MSSHEGLEGVVATETVLSEVDGANGRLTIRGHSLDTLAGRTRFEGAAALLFAGFFEDLPDGAGMQRALGAARVAVYERLGGHIPVIADLPVYDGMRALVALLPDGRSGEDALALLAAPAVLATSLMRLRAGQNPIAPDADQAHSADILRMLHGTAATSKEAAALDTYLVTVCDHGLNASTFTARTIASTEAGLMSAQLGALGALKGPLHGGAPGPVLDMLDTIAARGNIVGWLKAELAAGRRIMGFGHRIYRVRDPRADALSKALALLGDSGPHGDRLAFAQKVEREALSVLHAHKPDRKLETNVEFYTALLLEALGFPRDGFTAVFAMGRSIGWLAHAREQQMRGRLIRPASLYVGPQPSQNA